MATTQKTVGPKKSQGFQGVRSAFWIIAVCLVIALLCSTHGSVMQATSKVVTPMVLLQTYGVQSSKAVSSCRLSTLCCSPYWQCLSSAFSQ